jgi:DNA adenine methylase
MIKNYPLIKWPGGKRALLNKLFKFVPDNFQTYYEPFFGGGAFFFGLQPENAVLSDANVELIDCYSVVRENPARLVETLKGYENSEEFYYKLRAENPHDPIQRAARLLYLTRLSFNGIHRVNLKGQFNVPYGRKTHLETVDEKQIYTASMALKNTILKSSDFEEITEKAQQKDFIYFDPPYTVAHATNGFVKYNEKIFSWDDQIRLAKHAKKLADRGCKVLISNADHPSIHSLYNDFECEIIERFSIIAAKSTSRRKITECVFYIRG